MGKKATAAQTEQRIDAVMTMIAMGTTRPAILQHAAKNWNLATRSTDTLIAKARARFAEMAAPDREEMRGLALARYTYALFMSAAAGDMQRVIAAQKRIDDLYALEDPKTVQIVQKLDTKDAVLLGQLLDLMKMHDMSPGGLFAAMIEEIAQPQETGKRD